MTVAWRPPCRDEPRMGDNVRIRTVEALETALPSQLRDDNASDATAREI